MDNLLRAADVFMQFLYSRSRRLHSLLLAKKVVGIVGTLYFIVGVISFLDIIPFELSFMPLSFILGMSFFFEFLEASGKKLTRILDLILSIAFFLLGLLWIFQLLFS